MVYLTYLEHSDQHIVNDLEVLAISTKVIDFTQCLLKIILYQIIVIHQNMISLIQNYMLYYFSIKFKNVHFV